MTRTKAAPNGTAGTIDYATLTRASRSYEWYEMELPEGTDGTPLKVKVQRLTPREVEAIPADNTPIKDVIAAHRDYITAWNLTARTDAGDEIPVPPPAEVENVAELVEALLTRDEAMWLYRVLKFGHMIRLLREKKASMPSDTTPASPPAPDSTAAT